MPISRDLVLGLSQNQRGASPAWPETLARGIAASLGSRVTPHVANDYDELLGTVVASRVDCAWLPPLLQARAVGAGARLVALSQRGGWLTFRSALLVRKDDPVQSAGALRGVRAAWRDRHSASGYLFPRLELATLGAPPEKAFAKESFYNSVTEAAAAVAHGEADLCTCFVTDPAARNPQRAQSEIARTLGELANSLRVLHVTAPIPPDGFVVSPRMPATDATEVTRALLALDGTEAGRLALAEALQAERLAPVNETLEKILRTWSDAASARRA
jgi:ABC-type phosphate/phosphonate transport system substrate-binding protein